MVEKRKQKESAINRETLAAAGIPMEEKSTNVFRLETEYGAVVYYPSSNKWQHHGRTYSGTVAQLKQWLQSKGYL